MTKAHQHPLEKILESRIAIIDGAMGTTIRTYGMTEADIRGERFKNSTKDLLNNGDLFSLDSAGDDRRHPSPVSGGRSGHHRDEHLRRDQHHPERILCGRSAGARRPERIPRSTKRSSTIRSSAAWLGRSMSNRRGSAVNGRIVSGTQPRVNGSWRGRSGR